MIQELCDEANVRVVYEEVQFGTKLTFYRNDPYANNANTQIGGKSAANRRQSAALGTRMDDLLSFVAENGSVSRVEVSEFLGLGTSRTRQILAQLTSEGKLSKIGQSRATRYQLPE